MRLALETLEGTELGGWAFHVEEADQESSPHPVTVRAVQGDEEVVVWEGRTNPGTAWRHPWIEGRYMSPFGRDEKGRELEERWWAQRLPEVLVPGAYLMVSCDGHPDTLRELTVDVPPAATRIGYLLWLTGARWYKVWYYPEGWREGHEKLQGNLPLDEDQRADREAERAEGLERFLTSELADAYPDCADRATRLLDDL